VKTYDVPELSADTNLLAEKRGKSITAMGRDKKDAEQNVNRLKNFVRNNNSEHYGNELCERQLQQGGHQKQ
jgi:hypothetical protein